MGRHSEICKIVSLKWWHNFTIMFLSVKLQRLWMCHYLQYIFSSKDRTWRNLCANGKAKNQNQTNVIFELSGCTALKTGVSDCIIEITGRPLNESSSRKDEALCGHFPIWKGIVNAERLLQVLEQRTLPSREELAYFSKVMLNSNPSAELSVLQSKRITEWKHSTHHEVESTTKYSLVSLFNS